MNRYPPPKSVLVLDNCSIHHGGRIKDQALVGEKNQEQIIRRTAYDVFTRAGVHNLFRGCGYRLAGGVNVRNQFSEDDDFGYWDIEVRGDDAEGFSAVESDSSDDI